MIAVPRLARRLALLVLLAGCTGPTPPPVALDRPIEELIRGADPAPDGALAPRLRAVRALRDGGEVRLWTVRHTIEGDSIVSVLEVVARRARLTVDDRRDRFAGVGAIVDLELRDAALVRLEPMGGPPRPVDPDAAGLPDGRYLIVGTSCDRGGCGQRAF